MKHSNALFSKYLLNNFHEIKKSLVVVSVKFSVNFLLIWSNVFK